LTRNGFGRKRRSFGEINKMVIFREDVSKETSYLFKTKIYFREKVLKETSYKDRFMGKVLKAFFPFSIKI
jgi:hypothetical protein